MSDDPVVIALPSDKTKWVRLKTLHETAYGERFQGDLIQARIWMAREAEDFAVEARLYGQAALILVAEWNLIGKDGKPLPMTVDGLWSLDPDDGTFLSKKIGEHGQRLQEARRAPIDAPFSNRSSRRSAPRRAKASPRPPA